MAKLPSLLSLASFSGQVEAEFVAELTPPERQAIGAPDDWAAKDLVAHVTTWRERGAEDLKAILRGPLPPEPQEFDEVNRAIFDQNRGQAWEVVLGRVKKSWDSFTMALRDLTEDMLAGSGGEAQPRSPLVAAGYRRRWKSPRPPLRRIRSAPRPGRFRHTMDGRTISAPVGGRPGGGMARGFVHYNLACHYAQTGMPDKALDSLRAALELSPGLREWSRQDSDLAPLHPDPRFSSVVDPEG